MTDEQFEVLTWIRGSRASPGLLAAARKVLVPGGDSQIQQKEVAEEFGITPNSLWNILERYREADAKIRQAYCPEKGTAPE